MNPEAPDEDSSIEHLPYVIKIVNLAMEDRTGPYPLVCALLLLSVCRCTCNVK